MRKIRTMLVFGAVISTGVVLPGSVASAEADVFGGAWTSTDTDGSHQSLAIGASRSARRAATYFDDAATVCGGAPARLSGSASVEGATLTLRGALVCLPGGNPLRGQIAVAFTYNPSNDTLVDEFGITWNRV